MTQIKDYTKNKYVNLEALEKINQLFIVNQNNLTPDQINDIVAEYAQIEVIKPTFLVKEILPFIIKNQSLLKLSSQIKISHLFAKKDLYSEEFCRQMVSNFNNSAGTLTPSELVDMQWSLSKIRYFNQNFFQEWRNRIAPYVRSLENHELTKSILAIAKNDYYSENLVNEFVNILKDRDLNNHDLVSAIYSLSLIMETKNQPSLQTDIHELLQKVNLSSISTTIEMRQLISSYNSLSSSYKETLTKFHPELDIWKKHLHKEDQPTISRSQSFIKDLLTKYDLEAQEEVWLESLATNIDIYLPSIRTYVQVDGPTHFYRNDSSHYTTTSQFF